MRYARRQIQLDFTLSGERLSVTVMDDGDGFPPEILRKQEKKLLIAAGDGHMGVGLSVSRLLCRKHGGNLEIFNTAGGACVKISVAV